MILYYITDRRQFAGDEAEKHRKLLAKIAEAARCGVDFVQLREKDLSPKELLMLAQEAIAAVRKHAKGEKSTRLLINSRVDIALAANADGVHLTSNDIAASDARSIWARAMREVDGINRSFFVAASCHTVQEARIAEAHGADFAVFAPVFEKSVTERDESGHAKTVLVSRRSGRVGLEGLSSTCLHERRPIGPEGIGSTHMPVLALGGITLENARECVAAGAAGIAGIRLFQDGDMEVVVTALKEIETATQRKL